MKKILVVYWSASGNTEMMAKNIAKGAEADLLDIDNISAEAALDYEKIAFGCPSMGDTFAEAIEFFQWYENIETLLEDKKVAIFGSFGWGSGEWMDDWQERLEQSGAILFEEPLMVNETPSPDEEKAAEEFGKRFKDF